MVRPSRNAGIGLTLLCIALTLSLVATRQGAADARDGTRAKVTVVPAHRSRDGETITEALSVDADGGSGRQADAVHPDDGGPAASGFDEVAAVTDDSSHFLRLLRERFTGGVPPEEKANFPQDVAEISTESPAGDHTVFSLGDQAHISSSSLPEWQAKQVDVPLVYQLFTDPAATPLCRETHCGGLFVQCAAAAATCDAFRALHGTIASASLPSLAYLRRLPMSETLMWLAMLVFLATSLHLLRLAWRRLRQGKSAPAHREEKASFIVLRKAAQPARPRRHRHGRGLALNRRILPADGSIVGRVFREDLPWDEPSKAL